MTLNELPVGKAAVITKVGGAGALRCRLLDMGLIPKTKIVITKVAPDGRSHRAASAWLYSDHPY